jgi:hypothetical protein
MGCKGWQTFLASLLSGRRHLPSGRIWTVYLASFSVLASCGGTPAAAVPSPSPPTYNFAGISTHLHADTVQGIRATIRWSIAPRTGAQSAQSTWIGIFGAADPTTHLSLQIAQIGWKELPPKPPRVFWEWGTDRDHVSILYGQTIQANDHLDVELDRAADEPSPSLSTETWSERSCLIGVLALLRRRQRLMTQPTFWLGRNWRPNSSPHSIGS